VIAYIDASVVLRIVLSEPKPLAEWDELTEGVTSQIALVECHRGVYRAHATHRLSNDALASALEMVDETLARLKIVRLSNAIVQSASQPLDVVLGALDAVHLGTAIQFRNRRVDELIRFATHDQRLALAAQAFGFPVLGA
jgi:predicted nucleic acid-binding protein